MLSYAFIFLMKFVFKEKDKQIQFNKLFNIVKWLISCQSMQLLISMTKFMHFYQIQIQNKMKLILFTLICLCISILMNRVTQHEATTVRGTDKQFEIYRDNEGVPHIYAHTEEEALFALGYAEAEDRLWSFLIRKYLFSGRLAEVFGSEVLQSDYFARNFKFNKVGKMNEALLDDATRKKAQAYCDGINTYAKQTKMLPIQFYFFWMEWDEWLVSDSLSVLAFYSFSLEFDWMYEIARQRLLETVGFDLALQLINFGSTTLLKEVTIIKEEELKQQKVHKQYNASQQYEIIKEKWASKKATLGTIHLPTSEYEGSGSNAWVIGGEHTYHGKPILASDPHLSNLSPPSFYVTELALLNADNQVRIQTFGAIMSGVPAITIGVNEHFAWGSTAAYIDNKDIFYETVRVTEDNRFQYLYEGQWLDFTKREEIFKVRMGETINRTMYENHRGPIIENIFDELYYKYSYPLPQKYRENHTLTISAAIYEQDSTSLKGLIQLGFSQDEVTYMNASYNINSPNIDSVFMNTTGQFGYQGIGRIPKRDVPQMSGFIKDGTSSGNEMKGYLDNTEKPHLQNPKKGFIAMCNNKFAPDQFAYRSSLHQITTGRSYRLENIITNKIKNKEKFDFENIIAMQLDVRDEFASEAFPMVLKSLEGTRSIWSNEKTEKLYQLMKNWDYNATIDSVEASLYHVWERLFQSSLLIDTELNNQERQAIVNHAFFENYQFRLFEKIGRKDLGIEENKLCQNQEVSNFTHLNVHSCEVSAALAMKKLPKQLQEIFGHPNHIEYKWGEIHKAIYKSIPWSEIPGMRYIFQRQIPAGGNSRTLNVGIITHQIKETDKYRSIAGPVFRIITDMERTLWSLDLGNSGDIFSSHYDDFLGKNQYVEYEPVNPYVKVPESWKLAVKSK